MCICVGFNVRMSKIEIVCTPGAGDRARNRIIIIGSSVLPKPFELSIKKRQPKTPFVRVQTDFRFFYFLSVQPCTSTAPTFIVKPTANKIYIIYRFVSFTISNKIFWPNEKKKIVPQPKLCNWLYIIIYYSKILASRPWRINFFPFSIIALLNILQMWIYQNRWIFRLLLLVLQFIIWRPR